MGKIKILANFLFVLAFSFLSSCVQEEPVLYQGNADIRIKSESFQDTLRSCTCWFSADALFLAMGNEQFSGIFMDVESKSGIYQLTVKFIQDTDEDLEKGTTIPIDNERLKIKYSSYGERIVINGLITLQSTWQPPITNNTDEELFIEGSFACELIKKER